MHDSVIFTRISIDLLEKTGIQCNFFGIIRRLLTIYIFFWGGKKILGTAEWHDFIFGGIFPFRFPIFWIVFPLFISTLGMEPFACAFSYVSCFIRSIINFYRFCFSSWCILRQENHSPSMLTFFSGDLPLRSEHNHVFFSHPKGLVKNTCDIPTGKFRIEVQELISQSLKNHFEFF